MPTGPMIFSGANEQTALISSALRSKSCGGNFTPWLVERFMEELQIMARLSHPGIARLTDGGVTPEGCPLVVLENVDSLLSKIDR
ncbi:MAG: hypothetical protein RB191_06370 [Terriglobia bacterium]|nr:hypothetical protein [Terriglobia bacterium]